jgi:putative transposase
MHKRLYRIPLYREMRPVIFITTCTYNRKQILASVDTASILLEELRESLSRHGWLIGRYVIMPDHVHFLCAEGSERAKPLSRFMQSWKQWTSKRISRLMMISPPVWQKGFFDHVIRSQGMMRCKWEYIQRNPLRAGLVERVEDWPWQGEIFPLEKRE